LFVCKLPSKKQSLVIANYVYKENAANTVSKEIIEMTPLYSKSLLIQLLPNFHVLALKYFVKVITLFFGCACVRMSGLC
jgi:hypothetical protein